MGKLFNVFCAIILLFVMFSCQVQHNFYRKSLGRNIDRKYYNLKDTIIVKNYSLYISERMESLISNYTVPKIRKDSIADIFLDSFEKLNRKMPLKIENGKNHVDSIYYQKYPPNVKKIDENWIREVSGGTKGETVLVPFIYLNDVMVFTSFFTSGGGFGDNGWYKLSWGNLIVYVIRDNELIYCRHFRYSSEQTWADTRSEIEAIPPLAAVKQEHWDELVRLAMEDYIKRLK